MSLRNADLITSLVRDVSQINVAPAIYGPDETWHQVCCRFGLSYKELFSGPYIGELVVTGNRFEPDDQVIVGSLIVHGSHVVYGNSIVEGNLIIFDHQVVTGIQEVHGNLIVVGSQTVGESQFTAGDLAVEGWQSITKEQEAGGFVFVEVEASRIAGRQEVGGDLAVLGCQFVAHHHQVVNSDVMGDVLKAFNDPHSAPEAPADRLALMARTDTPIKEGFASKQGRLITRKEFHFH